MAIPAPHKPPVPTSPLPVPAGRDLSKEPAFDLSDIQADLLLGHSKKSEAVVFFVITDLAAFAAFVKALPITTAAQVYRRPGQAKAMVTNQYPPTTRFSVAFTADGLSTVGQPMHDPALDVLKAGLHSRAVAELNDDDPGNWIVGGGKETIHGVFIVTWRDIIGDIEKAAMAIFAVAKSGFDIVKIVPGNTRAGGFAGKEHFGFEDGVSQPGLRGCVDSAKTIPLTQSVKDPDQGLPGQDLLWPGEFLFGYSGQPTTGDDITKEGDMELPEPWMANGGFLVVRRLIQFVPEMHAGVAAAATKTGIQPALLESQLVGRWPSGAPVILSPATDNPTLGGDETKNNDFEFDVDTLGTICPWAAHIRKSYPRNDVRHNQAPTDDQREEEEVRTQQRRLLRRGIQFGPEVTPEEDAVKHTTIDRGLLFRCYVTDLDGQFEFVQKNWVNNFHFVQKQSGHDSIIGQLPKAADRTFFGVGTPGSKPSFDFKPWVKMTGGGYFFAPSLRFLSNLGMAA